MKKALSILFVLMVASALHAQVTPIVPTIKKPTPAAPKEKQVNAEISYYYAECVEQDGKMNLIVNATYRAENAKGKEVQARCIVETYRKLIPQSASESQKGEQKLINRISELESAKSESYAPGEISVNGNAGIRAESHMVSQSREDFNDRFSIPICSIDFKYYEKQKVLIKIEVFELSTNRMIGSKSFEQEVTPRLLYVEKSRRNQTANFDWSGGSRSFNIESCCGFEWEDVPYWIQTNNNTITALRNENDTPRSATIMLLPSCESDERILFFVTQEVKMVKEASRKPESDPTIKEDAAAPILEDDVIINSVSMEHNVLAEDGTRHLRFHVNLNVRNRKGQQLRLYAFFYNADGETQLINADGTIVTNYGYGTVRYESSTYDDFTFSISNRSFMKAKNLRKKEVLVYISATFDNGQTWETTSGPYPISW